MRYFKRESYLEKIRPFYDDDLIKVVTGVRRCGKSCLMRTVREELAERGVPNKDVIYLDLDKRGFRGVKTPDQLEEAIESRVVDDDFKYLFIDEVQNVDGFEEVVNGYNTDGGFSIFLTGSNSYLLSGELATKLTGRHISFDMFPLSFDEYLGMKAFLGKDVGDPRLELETYLRYGGFPKALTYDDPEVKAAYIEDVVNQIVEKDVKRRKKIRNVDAFERVMTYVINNYGAPTNLSNIVDHFTRIEHTPIKRETIAGYIRLLEDAKVICRCPRFDLKSRRSLRGDEKYYLSDLGIYFARNTDARMNWGPSLENVLYTYLRSRGYRVSVGKIGNLEVDFIARKHDEYAYVQVAMSIADRNVEEREYRPFSRIRDNYSQYLLTVDPILQRRDGVRHFNIADFMADGGEL